MSKLFFYLLLLGVLARSASAADSFVKFPKADAAWIVEVTYPNAKAVGEAGGASGFVKQVEVSRKGDIRRNILRFMDGSSSENWRMEGDKLRVVQHPLHGGIYIIPDSDVMMVAQNLVAYDQSLFDWVSQANFTGQQRLEQRECLHYTGKFLSRGAGSPEEVREAWIDAESGLPVALEVGSTLMKFRFLEAPSEIPPMSQKMMAALERYRRSIQPVVRRETQ